jgi:hypothetical protein
MSNHSRVRSANPRLTRLPRASRPQDAFQTAGTPSKQVPSHADAHLRSEQKYSPACADTGKASAVQHKDFPAQAPAFRTLALLQACLHHTRARQCHAAPTSSILIRPYPSLSVARFCPLDPTRKPHRMNHLPEISHFKATPGHPPASNLPSPVSPHGWSSNQSGPAHGETSVAKQRFLEPGDRSSQPQGSNACTFSSVPRPSPGSPCPPS